MKLAYLAFNKTAEKSHHVLGQYFDTIDTYIISESTDVCDFDLLNLPIMAHHVLVPSQIDLQTNCHKAVLQRLKNEIYYLRKNLFMNYSLNSEVLTGISNSSKNIFKFGSIKEISFDKTLNKHKVNLEGEVHKEYDYLIIESSEMTTSHLNQLKQNIVTKTTEQSHIILNLEFEIKYKVQKQHFHHEFVLINNPNLKSIFDNWFFCNMFHNKISCSVFIPYEKYTSEEFLKFITQRTHDVLSNSLSAFEIGDLIKYDFSASDGFLIRQAKLKYNKNSALFPTFTYWSQNKVNDYVHNIFIMKNKKNKNLFDEKGNT